MKNASTEAPKTAFALLLIGPPKAGKTTFALQFPNAYIADCDNNLSGPMRRLKEINKTDFLYDVINITDDGKETPEHLRWTRLTECVKAAVAHPDIKFIVIDSLSAVQDMLIAHILHAEKQKTMRIQDWGPFANLMKKLITFVRSSGKHLIICAHEMFEKDEADGIFKHFVCISGQLKNNIGGMFTDVWRAECETLAGGKDHRYTLRTMPTNKISLGNTLGLPPVMSMDYSEIAKRLTP